MSRRVVCLEIAAFYSPLLYCFTSGRGALFGCVSVCWAPCALRNLSVCLSLSIPNYASVPSLASLIFCLILVSPNSFIEQHYLTA